MTGTTKVDGADTFFESFMFAKIDKASGKMEWLIERSVWGPLGQDPSMVRADRRYMGYLWLSSLVRDCSSARVVLEMYLGVERSPTL